jgi:hypothetical protein
MEFIFYHPNSKHTFYLNESIAIRSLLLTGMKGTIYSELGTIVDDYLHPAKNSELYRIGLVSNKFPDKVSEDHQQQWEGFMKGMKTLRVQKNLPREGIIHLQKCEKVLDEKMKAVDIMLVDIIRVFEATELLGFFKDDTLTIVRPPFHFNAEKAEDMLVRHITETLIADDKIFILPSEYYQGEDEKEEKFNKEEFNKGKREDEQSINTAHVDLYKLPNMKGLNYNQIKAVANEISELLQPVLKSFEDFKNTVAKEKIIIDDDGRFDELTIAIFEDLIDPLQEQINNSIYFQHIINKKEAYPETTVCVGAMTLKGLVYMYYHMEFYSLDAALSILNAVSKHRDLDDAIVFLYNKVVYENMEHLSPEGQKKRRDEMSKKEDEPEIEML